MEIKKFLQKCQTRKCFESEIHSLLRRTDTRDSADVIWCTSLRRTQV